MSYAIKKVLLATKADLEKLEYPCIISPKLDGIRCVTPDGKPKSRTLKDIPNRYVQQCFRQANMNVQSLDGELVTYTEGKLDGFNTIQSKIMSQDGNPDFALLVFDSFLLPTSPFHKRLAQAQEQVDNGSGRLELLKMVPHIECFDRHQLDEFEEACVQRGYEGIMVRSPEGFYKEGRSTVKQGILLKVKRFEDIECSVIGSKPQYDVYGVLIPDRLGAFVVTCKEFGTFDVGSGFTTAQREAYWTQRDRLTDGSHKVTVKYQPFGIKNKPRFPTFKGFRHADDI